MATSVEKWKPYSRSSLPTGSTFIGTGTGASGLAARCASIRRWSSSTMNSSEE